MYFPPGTALSPLYHVSFGLMAPVSLTEQVNGTFDPSLCFDPDSPQSMSPVKTKHRVNLGAFMIYITVSHAILRYSDVNKVHRFSTHHHELNLYIKHNHVLIKEHELCQHGVEMLCTHLELSVGPVMV